MRRFEFSAGRWFVERDGEQKFDTDAMNLKRFPSSTWIVTTEVVSFPNYAQSFQYAYFGWPPEEPPTGPTIYPEQCSTAGRLVDQFWGPEAASPRNLPETDLGALPAGCNWLEVFASITRTGVPANIAGHAFPTEIQTSDMIRLEGGSCLVEQFLGTARLFEIVIDDGHAVLRRYQTAKDLQVPTHLIQNKAEASLGGRFLRQTDASPCSMVPIANYAAEYTADLSIRPCFVKL